jgi:hypothetical protein
LAKDPNEEPVLPVLQLLIVAVLVFLGFAAVIAWAFQTYWF